MLMSLGEVTYADRLAYLQNGTLIEQGGAWVMQADPLTQAMVRFVSTNLL